MNQSFSCDIIRDLLPGYIDGILSEAGTNLVKEHLEKCGECNQIYLEMEEELNIEIDAKEPAVLDGFKKLKQQTKKLKMAVGMISGLLLLLLLTVFFKIFVVGEALPAHRITIEQLSYQEETDTLEISGTIDLTSYRVSRVTWKQDREDENVINVFVYAAETLPFQQEQQHFSLSIPDIQGKTVYLAHHGYNRLEIYNWYDAHYEQIKTMKEAIYNGLPELDRNRDVLTFITGIESIDGIKGIHFAVESVVGENASFREYNGTIITDGELKDTGLDIWISIEQPHQISVYNRQTGESIE